MAAVSAPSSAAINAAARAGQLTQTSRSCRASRNTSASARPVDQLALQLLQPDAPLLRLQHLMRRLRLQEGRATAGRGGGKPLFAERVANRRDGRLGHRLQPLLFRRLPGLRRVGRLGSEPVGRRGVDTAIFVQNEPSRRLGLLDRAARKADAGGILALAHALHRQPRLSFKLKCLSG